MGKRTKEISVVVLAMLALFISPLVACACSHHGVTPEVNASSRHSHTAEHANLSDSENSLNSNDECVCIRAESKALVKFENSSPRDLVLLTMIEMGFVEIADTLVAAARPILLAPSDRLYGHRNFRPSRAPPRL
jgi:hypothetical protein